MDMQHVVTFSLQKKNQNTWKEHDHYIFTRVLCRVSPRCYSGIACFVLRATGQALASAEKQFRYRAWVCYCVWGGPRRSVALSLGRQECAETIRMRYLELQRSNTKRPAAWQVDAEAFWHRSIIVCVPDGAKLHKLLPRCHLGERKQWRVRHLCGTWDLAYWGQFWRLFMSEELTCFCDKCLCWTGTHTIDGGH